MSTMATHQRNWAAGVACIVLVALIWTLATVLKQVIFQDLEFDEPLILTVVCNSCYVVHLPFFPLQQRWRRSRKPHELVHGDEIRRAVRVGAVITPIWFLSQWSYSVGVSWTSVTSSTVISTTSCVWTLLASVVFLGETLTPAKILGVSACVAGNIVMLFGNDRQSGQEGHLMGDLLCLLSAMLYAGYTTVLKRWTNDRTPCGLIFGTVGCLMISVCLPLLLIFDLPGLQRMTAFIFGLLIFNGFFDDVVSQYAWIKAVQWTSPTAATVGLSLTIPMSLLTDIFRLKLLTVWSYVAGFLVVMGFVAVSLATKPEDDARDIARQLTQTEVGEISGVVDAAKSSVLPSAAPTPTLVVEAELANKAW